jgi:endonuclease YncB( thermonuclease family)
MTQIIEKDYQKILKKVQNSIKLARGKIIRNKVEMAWKIGRIIETSLPKNQKEKYGKDLIKKLEKDSLISATVLYKMRSFYTTYPKLPKDDASLNWSHYRVLSSLKKAGERKALEDLTKENAWDSDELQEEVTKRNTLPAKESKSIKKNAVKKIQPTRGRVFTYKIVEIEGSNKKFFDCGFKVYREVKESLPLEAEIVMVSGKDKKYLVKKSNVKTQQVYTYKAYLKRVVDGDTLHANIDLGFGIFHEEILRLAKINCAESKTSEGAKAKVALEKIFKDAPFFIVKSIKTDIFNRYVADIFLPKNKKETDLQKVADGGIYLNQLLLDHGLAEVF